MFLQSPTSQGLNMQSPHHQYTYMFYMFLFQFFLKAAATLNYDNSKKIFCHDIEIKCHGILIQYCKTNFFQLYSNLFHFSREHAAFPINLKSQHPKSPHIHTTLLMLMLMRMHTVYQLQYAKYTLPYVLTQKRFLLCIHSSTYNTRVCT